MVLSSVIYNLSSTACISSFFRISTASKSMPSNMQPASWFFEWPWQQRSLWLQCTLNSYDRAYFWPLVKHVKGFSLCVIKWRFRSDNPPKYLSQMPHAYRISPVWLRICTLRLLLWWKSVAGFTSYLTSVPGVRVDSYMRSQVIRTSKWLGTIK